MIQSEIFGLLFTIWIDWENEKCLHEAWAVSNADLFNCATTLSHKLQ